MALLEINIPKKVIGILFACVGAGLGFYFLPQQAKEKQAETNRLISESKELEAVEANLVNLQNNSAQFAADTEAFNKESAEILNAFPVFMFLEDKILYAKQVTLDDMQQYKLKEFVYGKSDYVMSTSYSESSLMELYSVRCAAEFEDLTYADLKSLISFGESGSPSQRFVLTSIEARFDEETGYLKGEFVYYTYFIAGQEKPYVFDPDVLELLGVDRRVNDLFGARAEDALEEDMWEGDYGDMVDDVLNDIVTGTDTETLDG